MEFPEQFRSLFDQQRRFLLLVSHMRSYSSLLSHLVAESPEVDGYGELHQSYLSTVDLAKMAVGVQGSYDDPISGDILFDKVLHRRYELAPEITQRQDVHVILSVRTPGPTLASLIALGQRDASVGWAANPERALQHYERRLSDLVALAPNCRAAGVLVADEVVRNPASTLAAISRFAELTTSLTTTYQVHPLTGHARFGDSSSAIMAGNIQQAPDQVDLSAVPAEVHAKARVAFNQALTELRALASVELGEIDHYL